MKYPLLLVLVLGACWVDNSGYRAPSDAMSPDATTTDLLSCPPLAPGGGTGMGRQEMLVLGGPYRIGGTSYSVADFYLDVYLVTVAAYRECVTAGTCERPLSVGACNFSDQAGAKEGHPVNCVSWAQAQAFCQWTGRRLPLEGEWQYAAAGTRMSAFPWGDDAPQAVSTGGPLCWAPDSANGTCPVGAHQRTLLGERACDGIADLAGDVWEWMGSEYHDPYVHPEPPCSAISSSCSLRGGSVGQ